MEGSRDTPAAVAPVVAVAVDDRTTVYFEAVGPVLEPGASRIQEAGAAEEAAERAVDTAGAVSDAVARLCARVVAGFDEVDERLRPTAATIEFAIAVSLEGNVRVVRGSAEASIKVTARWDLARPAGG